jgi:group II intron reverse transcriptase/maturase
MKLEEVKKCKKKKVETTTRETLAEITRISGKYEQIDSLCHLITLELLEDSLKAIKNSNQKRTSRGCLGLEYKENLEVNLKKILIMLKSKEWKPSQAKKRVLIKEGKRRFIYSFALDDQIVQKASTLLLEAVFEPRFTDLSYAYRPKRNVKKAVKKVVATINGDQMRQILQLDIKKCFDNINKDLLLEIIKKRIRDKNFIALLSKAINVSDTHGKPIQGVPQGSILAPLMANIFLDHIIDKWYIETICPKYKETKLLRYADDLIILAKSSENLREIENLLARRLNEFGLEISMEKTRRTDLNLDKSINFLGIDTRRAPIGDRFEPRMKDSKLQECISSFDINKIKGNIAHYKGIAPEVGILRKHLLTVENPSPPQFSRTAKSI